MNEEEKIDDTRDNSPLLKKENEMFRNHKMKT